MAWLSDYVNDYGQLDYKKLENVVINDSIALEDLVKEHPHPLLVGREVYEGELNINEQTEDGNDQENESDTSTVKFNINFDNHASPKKSRRRIPNVAEHLNPERNVYTMFMNPSGEQDGKLVINIGKSDDNQMVIKDTVISRKHARLLCRDDTYFLEDLGSTNGTKVSFVDVEPHQQKPLLPNARISLGRLVFVFTPIQLFYASLVVNDN